MHRPCLKLRNIPSTRLHLLLAMTISCISADCFGNKRAVRQANTEKRYTHRAIIIALENFKGLSHQRESPLYYPYLTLMVTVAFLPLPSTATAVIFAFPFFKSTFFNYNRSNIFIRSIWVIFDCHNYILDIRN